MQQNTKGAYIDSGAGGDTPNDWEDEFVGWHDGFGDEDNSLGGGPAPLGNGSFTSRSCSNTSELEQDGTYGLPGWGDTRGDDYAY